ncbi:endo-1,4-beta-xylanase [Neptunitalea chrysea]|uniref:Endo-1,4-beta-xylanase n=1 Tax=Neptunitalea chrysea TaxID=1647581 RepID=A0A9W6EU71_9FLAO|nr:alpha/beta hydrolase family protein [Neptunitalea chrysea]GLB52234.1 endo-1,4-beta-xylanase [Neptunitalea chrysea]
MRSKISFFATLFLLLGFLHTNAQQGSIINDSIQSTVLNKTKNYCVYLPAKYGIDTTKTYPVIYLLHGLGAKPIDWETNGHLNKVMSEAITAGEMPETIVIIPDGEATYYMNSYNNQYNYEDFFFKELLPYVEAKYHCGGAKTKRGVAGLSMGGFGTLNYSFHHPELFIAGSALSPAIRTDEEMMALSNKQFAIRYKTAYGSPKTPEDRINSFSNYNSPIYLAQHLKESDKASVKLYIDIGDDDYLYKGNATLHMVMKDLKIPHEYRVRNGGHTWDYWRTGLKDALLFITNNFE